MKAKVLKGGWSYLSVVRQPGDVVDAPGAQVAAWAKDGLVEPFEAPVRVERAVVTPPERAVAPPMEADRWPLKMEPEEYLERYPEGKHAEQARRVVEG